MLMKQESKVMRIYHPLLLRINPKTTQQFCSRPRPIPSYASVSAHTNSYSAHHPPPVNPCYHRLVPVGHGRWLDLTVTYYDPSVLKS